MDELFTDPREPWPEEIIVEPLRLETSLWGYPEGDISAAYCADTFPKIKTFRHQGQTFTNMGGDGFYAHCYPLLPITDGDCSEPVAHSREGNEVICQGQKYKLGPKVKFTVRERTLEEGVDLLRRQYAYGGYFASGKTYREVLLNFRENDEIPQWEKAAIDAELARAELPQTQAEMLQQIRKRGDGSAAKDENQTPAQLTLDGI